MLKGEVRWAFRGSDALLGVVATIIFVLPYVAVMILRGATIAPLAVPVIIYQLFGVAFPEEVYFRGFLQERLGNTKLSVFLVSILFAGMHLPRLVVFGDAASLLTFFPSLIMGYLYFRTSNLLPCVIFHFVANSAFAGLYDILFLRPLALH
jgi:membrane protease YdiL (CAAX protease family)